MALLGQNVRIEGHQYECQNLGQNCIYSPKRIKIAQITKRVSKLRFNSPNSLGEVRPEGNLLLVVKLLHNDQVLGLRLRVPPLEVQHQVRGLVAALWATPEEKS